MSPCTAIIAISRSDRPKGLCKFSAVTDASFELRTLLRKERSRSCGFELLAHVTELQSVSCWGLRGSSQLKMPTQALCTELLQSKLELPPPRSKSERASGDIQTGVERDDPSQRQQWEQSFRDLEMQRNEKLRELNQLKRQKQMDEDEKARLLAEFQQLKRTRDTELAEYEELSSRLQEVETECSQLRKQCEDHFQSYGRHAMQERQTSKVSKVQSLREGAGTLKRKILPKIPNCFPQIVCNHVYVGHIVPKCLLSVRAGKATSPRNSSEYLLTLF